jgi:flagellar basal body P-ring formation protein FlgA
MKYLLPTTFSMLAAAASAQTSPVDPMQQLVQREAAAAAGRLGNQVRLEVSVGTLPSGLQLAPCARMEPFIPSGVRMWGRTYVGMRCMEGATWSALVPVTVKMFGPALVATRPLPAMQPIAANDLHMAEVEWTREPQGVATETSQLDNRVLVRPIGVGQPVPLAALRAPQAVGQGDPVKVVGQGRGFEIQTDGIALATAQDGQTVRVRTESGRILTGTARAGRTVEVQF